MILKELSEAVGVSGKEDAVRRIILDAIKDHATDIRIDPLGSVTALKKGTGKKPLRVMVAAHMDEIGFMAMGFDGDGLIRFASVGGVDDRILPGLRVKVGDGGIPGVIVWAPIHKTGGQNSTVKLDALRIDIGADGKNGTAGKVNRGDRIAFDTQFAEMSERVLRGKAFDDRAGCSLLVDLLQNGPYTVDVLAAFTVQEEIGLRGARVAAQALKPDIAIVLEGTTAHDLPDPGADPDDSTRRNPATRMGYGPALTVMDRSMIADPRLLGFLRRTADANGIPYQLKTALGGGTDAGAIHVSNAGVPSAVISLPCRYIHSPAALLHRDDYDNALRLLQAALNSLMPAVLKRD
jgi:endoglucanase